MPIGAIATVGAAVAIGGTVSSIKAQKKAAKEARKANKFQRQMSELQSARQKIEALRAGRQAMAQAQQNAENQGAADTSVAKGGAGSIFSQTMGNLSFLNTYGYYSDQATEHLQKSANYGAKAGMWSSIAGLGSSIYSASGGFNFKGPPPPPPPTAG